MGKGIYDVDAFEASLDIRVPVNSLLSHDLFEGSFARAALCTDIHVIDDYPFHYLNFAARQHRWVRGDWQIARWIWPTVPDAYGRPVPNRCRRSRAGRSSTTSAAAWSRPRWSDAGRGLDLHARVAGTLDHAGAPGHRLPGVHNWAGR